MASIQFGLTGEVVSEDYSEPVGDPTKQPLFTDAELEAVDVPEHLVALSREQANLLKIRDEIQHLEAKAVEVTHYDANGVPQYAYNESDRATFAKAAQMKRDTQLMQLEISKRSLATAELERRTVQQDLHEQGLQQDRLRALALQEVERRQVNQLADVFTRNNPKLQIG